MVCVLMREAGNPQGSTSSFRGVSVVRLETCAHGARVWQTKNLILAPLAQLAEHLTLNQRVVGSSPTGGTRQGDAMCRKT